MSTEVFFTGTETEPPVTVSLRSIGTATDRLYYHGSGPRNAGGALAEGARGKGLAAIMRRASPGPASLHPHILQAQGRALSPAICQLISPNPAVR